MGWAKEGLIRIDIETGKGTLVYPDDQHNIEGLAWNESSTLLYATVKQDHQQTRLLVYDGKTLTTACDNMPGEIESLAMGPNNQLIFGQHDQLDLNFHFYDIATCQLLADEQVHTYYHDIEAIAWPSADCTAQQQALRAFFIGLSNNDGVFIGADRILRVTLAGQIHQGQLAEEITQGQIPANGQLQLVAIVDANQDDIDDFLITLSCDTLSLRILITSANLLMTNSRL